MFARSLKVTHQLSVIVSLIALGQLPGITPAFAEGFSQRADYTAWLHEHPDWKRQHPSYVEQMIYEVPIGKSPAVGPADAKVTIVEFVDFSDSYSRQLAMGCQSLMLRYPGKIRIVFKNYPNANLPNSLVYHKVAMAALLQGQDKFWLMYKRMFLMPKEGSRDEATFSRWAKEINLDVDKFERDRNSPEVMKLIDGDIADAKSCKMSAGAPKFFLNGRRVVTPKSWEQIANGVEFELHE